MKKLILQLCADTGSDSKVWRDNGYEVIPNSMTTEITMKVLEGYNNEKNLS